MSTIENRRQFLKFCLTTGVAVSSFGAGLLLPRTAVAIWPKMAFEARSSASALKTLLGSEKSYQRRYAITVKARPYADDGGTKVTITISTSLKNVESVALIVTNNPTPLAAHFQFYGEEFKQITTRTKIEANGEIIAVLKTGDKLYNNRQKVDLSGCGCR